MQNNRHDIQYEKDVELMVDCFYEKVNQDELLSYVFNDFSKVDWNSHLPTMYRFWNTLIFGKQSYKGNPFAAHLPLPIDKAHFHQWLKLFEENINELFKCEVAEQVKLKARSIAHIFYSKLEYINQGK